MGLKANELKQNNWVLLTKDNFKTSKPYQLTAFDIYKADESDCADIKPIELSEEILLKCGFELITEDGGAVGNYTFWSNGVIELNNLGYWFIVSTDFNHPKINYLHQLQNFYFSIKQTELEINL